MLKYFKSAVLFIFLFAIIGCSNIPEGISKEQYENGVEIAQVINENFENKSQLDDDTKAKVEKYISEINNDNFKPSSNEEVLFLSEINFLYMFYDYYLKYLTIEETEQINFNKQKYIDVRENLKTKYNVEF